MVLALGLTAGSARLLDDFDDGQKRGWVDYAPGNLGNAMETGWGMLRFTVPVAQAAQPLYVTSGYMAERFNLQDGQVLEFRADVVEAVGTNTSAVLAWVPDTEPLSQLTGYFLAQSARRVRIGKGLGRYFLDAQPDPPLKNTNVTLVLRLSPQAGAVRITAQILDTEADHAVLFEQSVVDTSGPDTLAAGADQPAAPFLGLGHLALIAEAEEEEGLAEAVVSFDNAEASPPPLANQQPYFHDVRPTNSASFLPLSTEFRLYASDDKSLWEDPRNPNAIAAFLGEPFVALAIGAVTGSEGRTLVVSAARQLKINTDYEVRLFAMDAEGVSNVVALRFDTFCPFNPIIELEDYNFEGGRFIDGPVLSPEGAPVRAQSYQGRSGEPGVDFQDTRATATGRGYRPLDPVGLERSLDYLRPWYLEAGGPETNIFDYDVRGIEAGEYLVYTRTFPAAEYRIYLREAVLNLDQAEATLERITMTGSGEPQATELGRFIGRRSGFEYRNVPLTDAAGKPVRVKLEGLETLRLRQGTSAPEDGGIFQNYMVFVGPFDSCFEVQSAPEVCGPYEREFRVVVEGATVRIDLAPEQNRRFYRLRTQQWLDLHQARREGTNLVFEVGP